MKGVITAILLLLTSDVFSQQKKPVSRKLLSASEKTILVYTTADSTDYRLSKTDKVDFIALPQPTEGEVSIFVDPDKTFQTFLGIGAALTDASAETFAKLSKEKQQEFLQAYFDKDKGIGYTLARTNIHSCDFSSQLYLC